MNELGRLPGAIELGVCTFKKRKMSDHMSDEDMNSDSDDESGMLLNKSNGPRRRVGLQEEEKGDRRSKIYNPRDDPYSIADEEKKDEARELLTDATKQYKHDGAHGAEEIWIHQLIETIEFVLGTISNTASYLRLWALSLAHSQLAEVFFSKLIEEFVKEGHWFALFIVLPMYLSANFFILICMDAMECFLHTLRLHWVEFQNKFYSGSGYNFNTFSLPESSGFEDESDE